MQLGRSYAAVHEYTMGVYDMGPVDRPDERLRGPLKGSAAGALEALLW